MKSNTVVILVFAAIIALAFYAVVSVPSTDPLPPPAATVPDTSSSWKNNDSLKAKCDQKDLTPLERNLLNCTN